MLDLRRRRWANNSPAFCQRLVFDRLHDRLRERTDHGDSSPWTDTKLIGPTTERWEVKQYVSTSIEGRHKYISPTFTPSISIAGAGHIHPILASESCCACLYIHRCRPTHPISAQYRTTVADHCWFNDDKLSTTLAQHYSNTGSAVYLRQHPKLTRVIYLILSQCWANVFNVDPTQGDCSWFVWTVMRVTHFSSRRQKNHYPDNTIHWTNADVMMGHRVRRFANIIPAKTL